MTGTANPTRGDHIRVTACSETVGLLVEGRRGYLVAAGTGFLFPDPGGGAARKLGVGAPYRGQIPPP
jgi:hypothetical protein